MDMVLVGFVAGLVGSMLGVGGGLIIVPFLTLVHGLSFPAAVGISMVGVTATSVGATGRYFAKGLIEVQVGLRLEAVTVLGVLAAEPLFRLIPASVLTAAFAVLLAVTSWRMIRWVPRGGSSGSTDQAWSSRRRRWAAFVVSGAAGSVAALLGIGGGILKVPVFTELLRIDMHRAVATSTFMIGVTAATASSLAVLAGRVAPHEAAGLVLGVLPGAMAGSRLAPLVPQVVLRRAFGILLAWVAFMMIRRVW